MIIATLKRVFGFVLIATALISAVALAWERPLRPLGHLFIYEKNDDFPVFSSGVVALQMDHLGELITQTLPSSHVHLYSQNDLRSQTTSSGPLIWDPAFYGLDPKSPMLLDLQKLAQSGTKEPIDVLTLTHSDGNIIEIGFGNTAGVISVQSLMDAIPSALVPNLRLFSNTGCYGADSYKAALTKGFRVAVGAPYVSLGPLIIEEFLTQWLQGASAEQAASRMNWSCTHSLLWKTVFAEANHAGALEQNFDSIDEYCQQSGMTVIPAYPGAERITIESSVP